MSAGYEKKWQSVLKSFANELHLHLRWTFKLEENYMGVAALKGIHCDHEPKPAPAINCPAAERATLDFLRAIYQSCRAKPRHDLFAACDLLIFDRHIATSTYAEAILRTLWQTLGRRPNLLRPGDETVTFDESWLLALLRSCGRARQDDIAFLMASRVAPRYRPNLQYLMSQLSHLLEVN